MRLCPAMTIACAIAISIPSAKSDDIPALNVEQLCRGIASQSYDPLAKSYPKVSFDRCMEAEMQDREQLRKVWSTFLPEDKRHCVTEAKMGGSSSYTELITCLEMARDVRALRSHQPMPGPDR